MSQTEINKTISQLYQAAKSAAESKDANAEELKRILSEGICINITNEKGETAGSIAGRGRDTQVAQILLSHGANINEIAQLSKEWGLYCKGLLLRAYYLRIKADEISTSKKIQNG